MNLVSNILIWGLCVCALGLAGCFGQTPAPPSGPAPSNEVALVSNTELPTATSQAKKPGKHWKPTTKPLTEFDLGRYQYCGSDRDCVVAINGCCDCANGGVEVAVNRTRLEKFRSRFECLKVNCGKKIPAPACGSGVVTCIEHRCRYVPAAPGESF